MQKTFHIYRSSAGSGKTRTLAKEYLSLALRFRSDYFKHILAVTFTNKSTQEMKNRIMRYLNEFAQGDQNELALELQKELKLDPQTFQNYAQEVQASILHNYHQFSISTIDAFFQKVIRAFTREAGILGDYRLEVEQDEVMEEVISNLIADLGPKKQLTDWVVELALQNLENDRSWDMRKSLASFSNEIFREEFKAVEDDIARASSQKNFFPNTLTSLREKKYAFIKFVRGQAQATLSDIQSHGFSGDDFKYSGGIYNAFEKFSKLNSVKDYLARGSRVENEFQITKNWPAKESSNAKEIIQLAEKSWLQQLNQILDYGRKNLKTSLSAEIVLSNFYAFGLLTDISKKLAEYKRENNLMLLADAPQFLNGIIRDSDTPFIYEKAGSFYRNFLIDEFQDTSGLQWKNFQPLLINSLDSGHHNLIVGDVKQAIYRWRGGNQHLLQEAIETVGTNRTETKLLNSNFRSSKEIVAFNNEFFKTSSVIASTETGLALSLNEYADVIQKETKSSQGYVSIKFISDDGEIKWNDRAVEQTIAHIEELQQKGIKPSEIALLVRKNDEGEKIISSLIDYKNSSKAKPNCKYDVVSSESLRIDSAASVNLLVSILSYLLNPNDDIARAQLAYEYARQQNNSKKISEVFGQSTISTVENDLPKEFSKQKLFLKKLPLLELTETLIDIFDLKQNTGEVAYLLAFQDLVIDFVNRERNDLGAFLTWWLEYKYKKYIVAPASAEAMQIFTVHKAKGLQFKHVVIPFCSWLSDHDGMKSPQLWVNSEESIFKNFGYLPVKYSSTLKESFFADAYDLEHGRAYLDNFNLLYVALTRAEISLTVFAPDPTVSRIYKQSIARLLHETIEKSPVLSTKWNKVSKTWHSGEIEIDEIESKDQTLSLKNYHTGSWRSKLVVKHSSNRFEADESESRIKINFGIHLHAALAYVKTSSDILLATKRMLNEGTITIEEQKLLEDQFTKLLSNPQIANWFSDQWEIKTEVHTLLPGGDEFRIDRLLIKDKQAVIIDYKTGKQRKEDHNQIAEYCKMLSQMGFNSEGYLLYLTEGAVVSVVPPKANKKKVENQLGLDF
ncbi:MAG: UvrD-helicase domain-containing protein [Cyclobacteriaceae bacterium]